MNYPGARLARRFQRHLRRSESARHETDAPTRSQHGRSDPLVLRWQQSDLAQSTRLVCEMRVLITAHLGFIGAVMVPLVQKAAMRLLPGIATRGAPNSLLKRKKPAGPKLPRREKSSTIPNRYQRRSTIVYATTEAIIESTMQGLTRIGVEELTTL
jgi:hypothetical protein